MFFNSDFPVARKADERDPVFETTGFPGFSHCKRAALPKIGDPGAASAILLVKLAETSYGVPQYQQEIIERFLSDNAGMKNIADVMQKSEDAAKLVGDPADIIKEYKTIWQNSLNRLERKELLAIAGQISDSNMQADNTRYFAVDILRFTLEE